MNDDDWSGIEVSYPVAHVDRVWLPGDIEEGDYFRRRGYLKAARMLIHACDNGTGEHLLLPALGCYRQYFELQLKELARVGRAIRAEAGHDRRGHRLDITDITETLTHVNTVDGRSEQQAKAMAKRDLRKLKAAIDELNRLDPAAVTFRYSYHLAEDGARTPTVPKGHWLDLPGTLALLEAGAAIAEGADLHLDAWRSNYADYLADMAQLEAEYAADYTDMVADYDAGPWG